VVLLLLNDERGGYSGDQTGGGDEGDISPHDLFVIMH